MTDPVRPATRTFEEPPWWERGICYLIIVWSAFFVFLPSLRTVQPATFAANVLFVGWGARRFLRDKRNGLLDKSPAQLYQMAKSGRRFRVDRLETATIAAFALTTAVQMHAVWP